MPIEHIAVWTRDLEKMKDFYTKTFHGEAGEKYINPKKGFESYFIRFSSGPRLELMHSSRVDASSSPALGYAHMAFAVGSKEAVDRLTHELKVAGYCVLSGPRTTGDGYYESCILDPEGNAVEITV